MNTSLLPTLGLHTRASEIAPNTRPRRTLFIVQLSVPRIASGHNLCASSQDYCHSRNRVLPVSRLLWDTTISMHRAAPDVFVNNAALHHKHDAPNGRYVC
jgi:hypothetical protein